MSKQTKQTLSESVLYSIQNQAICPRSRTWFVLSELLMWVGLVLSVLLGGLAVSILVFASLHGWYGLYELIDMSRFGYVTLRISFVWPVVWILTILLALYNARCTKRGYRFTLAQLSGGVLAASIGLGIILYWTGIGFTAERWLDKTMPMYSGQDTVEYAMWHQPSAGRIVGVAATTTAEVVTVATIDGDVWVIETMWLMDDDDALLRSGTTVHIVGTTTGEYRLRGCAVIAPMLKAETTKAQLQAERTKRADLADAVASCM